MSDNKRKSTYAILKSDIRKQTVQVYKCKDKVEYHIFRKDLPNKLIMPRPVLWAIIVCKEKHILKNVKKGIEVIGIRYLEDEMRQYLKKNKKRQKYELRFLEEK